MTNTGKKVLILDDDPDFAYVFSLILKSVGYDSEIALNPEKAFSILEIQKISIVFLDFMLKEQRGTDIAVKLKNRFTEIKIIILSAISEKSKDEFLKNSCIDGFLAKPVKKEQLLKVLT